jgi:plasmid replication initiation protein
MSLTSEVNKNDMDMLFLSMSSSELNLLKLMVKQLTKGKPVSIDLKDYLVLEGGSIDALMQLDDDDFHKARNKYFDEAEATANKLFGKSFKYQEGNALIRTRLFGFFSCHPISFRIEITCSDNFYDAMACVGFDTVASMLDTYSKPPISQLARAYSAKLYVLLTQRQVGEKNVSIAYSDLREELCIDEDSYSLMQNFKRRVLDLAVSDINEFTLSNVSYEDVIEGRKITHFDFTVHPKPDAQ